MMRQCCDWCCDWFCDWCCDWFCDWCWNWCCGWWCDWLNAIIWKKDIWWHFLETGRIPKRLFVVTSTNVKKCFISGFKPAHNHSLWQVLITISRTQKSRMTFQWLKTHNELKNDDNAIVSKFCREMSLLLVFDPPPAVCDPKFFLLWILTRKKWTISAVKKNSGLCSSCANPTSMAWSHCRSSSFC